VGQHVYFSKPISPILKTIGKNRANFAATEREDKLQIREGSPTNFGEY
jgi:hypothetical protein